MTTTQSPRVAGLRQLLAAMAAHPDKMFVDEVATNRSLLYSVVATNRDYARIIGKGGQTVRALLVLVKLIAGKEGREGSLAVEKPDSDERAAASAFTTVPEWDERAKDLIQLMLTLIFVFPFSINMVPVNRNTFVVEIRVSPDEPLSVFEDGTEQHLLSEDVDAALKLVFGVIGKSNGWNVELEMMRIPSLVTT